MSKTKRSTLKRAPSEEAKTISARVKNDAYQNWLEWCERLGVSSSRMLRVCVAEFLESPPGFNVDRQVEAFRKLESRHLKEIENGRHQLNKHVVEKLAVLYGFRIQIL